MKPRKASKQWNENARSGAHVIFVDSQRKPHDALVTAWHGETCINVVFVSSDELRKDNYGRQIEREPTSVVHRSLNSFGNYWHWPDE
jgi:hypothetical protein